MSTSSPKIPDDISRRFTRYGRWRQKMRRSLRMFIWIFFILPVTSLKRFLDFFFAFVLLILCLPLFILAAITGGIPFEKTPRIGRWGIIFNELSFRPHGIGKYYSRLPVLLNILRGNMSFVGPRRISPGDIDVSPEHASRRSNVRPGLICVWWLRTRTNINYTDELTVDSEYVEHHSLWGDIGIAFRAIPAVMYGSGVETAPSSITMLDIPITNITISEACDLIITKAQEEGHYHVCFINADCVNLTYHYPEYFDCLKHASCVLPDGIGLKIAGKILQCDIRQNVNGTDLFPRLCEKLQGTDIRLFLLGAQPGVVEKVEEWIHSTYPGITICGVHHGYFTPEQDTGTAEIVKAAKPDILLVGRGAPLQDIWLQKYLKSTGAHVGIGVGGLFDFYSGSIRRAPMWVREMGCEWLFRFFQEPGRMWKRYFIGNSIFLYHVIRQKFSKKSSTPLTS